MVSEKEQNKKLAQIEENNNHNEVTTFPITQGFLEVAFDKIMEKFSVYLGTNPGDNYLSTIYAAEVIFEGEDLAKHYFIKCNPERRARREYVGELKVFEKELFFYQDFLPKLNQVVKECGTDTNIVGLSLAPFLEGNLGHTPSGKWKGTEWAKETFLIMTDIRKSQFVMQDCTKGLDMDHATLAIKVMAKFHALTWAYKEKNEWLRLSEQYPNLVDRIYSIDGISQKLTGFFNQINGEVLKLAEDSLEDDHPVPVAFRKVKLTGFFNRINGEVLKLAEDSLGKDHPVPLAFRKVMEADVIKIIRTFLEGQGVPEEVYEDMLRTSIKCEDEYSKEPWLTGTHGDCWLNNMLFRYNANGSPTQVVLVDLQNFREVCPTMEIAHFLYSSVRAPIRIPGKEQLLRAYHDTFLHCCRELTVKPYPGFSFNNLMRRFRRSELFGLLVSIPVVAYSLKTKEQEVTLTKEGSKKNLSAVEGMDKNVRFNEEVVQTLVDLYENGVI